MRITKKYLLLIVLIFISMETHLLANSNNELSEQSQVNPVRKELKGSITIDQSKDGKIQDVKIDLGEFGEALGLKKELLGSSPIIINYDKEALLLIVLVGLFFICLYKLTSILIAIIIDGLSYIITRKNLLKDGTKNKKILIESNKEAPNDKGGN